MKKLFIVMVCLMALCSFAHPENVRPFVEGQDTQFQGFHNSSTDTLEVLGDLDVEDGITAGGNIGAGSSLTGSILNIGPDTFVVSSANTPPVQSSSSISINGDVDILNTGDLKFDGTTVINDLGEGYFTELFSSGDADVTGTLSAQDLTANAGVTAATLAADDIDIFSGVFEVDGSLAEIDYNGTFAGVGDFSLTGSDVTVGTSGVDADHIFYMGASGSFAVKRVGSQGAVFTSDASTQEVLFEGSKDIDFKTNASGADFRFYPNGNLALTLDTSSNATVGNQISATSASFDGNAFDVPGPFGSEGRFRRDQNAVSFWEWMNLSGSASTAVAHYIRNGSHNVPLVTLYGSGHSTRSNELEVMFPNGEGLSIAENSGSIEMFIDSSGVDITDALKVNDNIEIESNTTGSLLVLDKNNSSGEYYKIEGAVDTSTDPADLDYEGIYAIDVNGTTRYVRYYSTP